MPLPTAAETVSRINAVFGDGITTRQGGKISSKDSPLLYGVMMRALHRKEQGLELSSLEQRLTALWGAFVKNAPELAEHGKLYSQENIASSIPDEVTNHALDKPYTWDDLLDHSEKASDKSLLVSGAASAEVVDLAKGERPEGGLLGDTNSQVTFYTHSGNADPAAAAKAAAGAPPMAGADQRVYNIVLDKFKCIQKADDSIFDQDNEIYWCYSAAGDGDSRQYVTGTYGGIVTGSERFFDHESGLTRVDMPGNYPLLWTGTMDKDTVIVAHIECWEQDDGGSTWKATLQDAMLELSKTLTEAANESRAKKGRGTDWTLVAAAVAAVIAGLLELFKNPDDCVLKRTIILDWNALYDLWYQSYKADQWHFNGGSEGYHTLTLRYMN